MLRLGTKVETIISIQKAHLKSNSKFEKQKLASINMNENMKNFQKSMNFEIVQCKTCFESWPINKPKKFTVDDYICTRCKRDRGSPKKFSAENNMKPSPVPEALTGLTQIDWLKKLK